MNWDDLHYFLAIARTDSLSAARRKLGVSQPTVSCRPAAMEVRLEVRLIDRTENGYVLTPAGDEIFDTVQHVEEELASIDRRVAGKDLTLRVDLRITCTEVFANLYLAKHLSRVLQLHPEINISVVCTFQHLSLSRHEADITIRVTSKPPETLIGRRLTKVAMGVYFGGKPFPAPDAPINVETQDWIGRRDETCNRMLIYSQYPKARIPHRVDDMLSMRSMARSGIGVVTLPCYVGDQDPELHRIVGNPIVNDIMNFWVLSHPVMRCAARVRALSEFMSETISVDRDLFKGRRPFHQQG